MPRSAGRLLLLSTLLFTTLLTGCDQTQTPAAPGGEHQITILYTNDEHGWMAPSGDYGGAAGMAGLWRDVEGYTEDGPYLILSGGDAWTGPALSSWFDGESMIEVMNSMGYVAAAIGNHEFDNTIETLAARQAEAELTFVSANIVERTSGQRPAFATPYIIEQVGELRIGIIGLTSLKTPRTTRPSHVADLRFLPYNEALNEIVPQVKAEGADLLVIAGHICTDEMQTLVPAAKALGIAVITGAHCHQSFSAVTDGIALIQAGANLRAYGRVDITFDSGTQQMTQIKAVVKTNKEGTPAADVTEIVAAWQAELGNALSHVIGYTRTGISRNSNAMYNMIADAWLAAYPADVAMTNPGGIRQDIPAGEITLETIVGVLPFDNVLVDAAITGRELISSYRHTDPRRPAVGGMSGIDEVLLPSGAPIDPQATYHILINDFMYEGGDSYQFASYDPDAYNTGIDWRQPVIDWIIAQRSSQEQPLELKLDNATR